MKFADSVSHFASKVGPYQRGAATGEDSPRLQWNAAERSWTKREKKELPESENDEIGETGHL